VSDAALRSGPRSRPRWVRRASEAVLPRALVVRRGLDEGRRVALTLDDGPDHLTFDYLDCLDRLGVKATFFVVGSQCLEHPDALAEMTRRGHEVFSHGFTHRCFPDLSPEELRDELQRTAALLPRAAGRPKVRPPQGKTTISSLLRCGAAGYQTVLWSLDSDDCRIHDAGEVVSRCSPFRVTAGEIILLHEGQPWTLAALPRIVENLRRARHELVPVGELLSDSGE
jgi:peptidoglycan-N-acetylglucosamine deacetylase